MLTFRMKMTIICCITGA